MSRDAMMFVFTMAEYVMFFSWFVSLSLFFISVIRNRTKLAITGGAVFTFVSMLVVFVYALLLCDIFLNLGPRFLAHNRYVEVVSGYVLPAKLLGLCLLICASVSHIQHRRWLNMLGGRSIWLAITISAFWTIVFPPAIGP